MFTLTKLNVLWDKVKALEARPSGSDIPEVTSEDAGDVLMVSDTGEWEANELDGLLPEVDNTDNGKLLGVSNGEWSKVDAPSINIDYSTTEQNTGRKWIDGKPIYCKTIDNLSINVSSTTNWTTTDITIENAGRVIDFKTWRGDVISYAKAAFFDTEQSDHLRFVLNDTGTVTSLYVEYVKNLVTRKNKTTKQEVKTNEKS